MPLFPFFMNIEGANGLIVGTGKHAQEKIERLKNTNVKATVTRMLYEFFSRIPIAYNNPTIIFALDSSTKSTGNFALNEEYKQNRNKEEKKYKDIKEVEDLISEIEKLRYF